MPLGTPKKGVHIDGLFGDQEPLTIVLLEDDPADAKLFSIQVADAWPTEISLVVCPTVAELVSRLGDIDPAAVFCDLSLPDGSGIEVVERALASTEAPVIVLTGLSDREVPMQALQLGAQDYLQKSGLSRESLARSLRHSIARQAAEYETRKVSNELRKINSELDQFAGVVAHDLRAPVRTARLLANRLIVETGRGKDVSMIETALEGSLERMELLIERLLTMASMRDQTINPKPELLSSILTDVEAQLSDYVEETNARLELESDGIVFADPKLIRELLRHLVHNSVQFRDPENEPTIKLSFSTDGQFDTVVVSDNGIGVPENYHKRVFQLFERLSSGGPSSAVGFGLALCQQVVELHHGSIAMKAPASQVGAEVSIKLPCGPTLGSMPAN